MSDTPKLLALMAVSRNLPALDYSKQLEVLVRELERENAALRAALDCIAGNCGERSPVTLTEAQEEARDALAFSKKAQP